MELKLCKIERMIHCSASFNRTNCGIETTEFKSYFNDKELLLIAPIVELKHEKSYTVYTVKLTF